MSSDLPVVMARASTYKDSGGRELRVQGSVEHYFHFLIGYLLPTVHQIYKRELFRVIVADCGPVMNRVLSEVLGDLGVGFEYAAPITSATKIDLPAWDFSAEIDEGFFQVAGLLEARAFSKQDCCRVSSGKQLRLLLDRMPSHEFYSEEGPSKIKGFGRSRRFIPNLKAVSDGLRILGIDHILYSPGEHTIWCQIRHFAQASHITGIRGAEWANLAWARPGTQLRVVYPNNRSKSILKDYLEKLGLEARFKFVNTTKPRESLVEVIAFFVGGRRGAG